MSLSDRSTASLIDSIGKTTSKNYRPAPIVFDHGEDSVYLVDREGRRYLDFVAGIAVNALGYNHPVLMQALHAQVDALLHVSNMFVTEPQLLLQEKIVESSFADRVFFCNSGAESNEAAMKLARRYQTVYREQPERFEIVAATKSFHGRTMGAIKATGQPKYWAGFEPLPEGFVHVPFNDLEAMAEAITDRTAAVLLEPVQGEGGIQPATQAYLEGVRALCDERGALLIFDEVQCGVGRLGTLWAYERFGVTPDIATWAKGIAGGVPLGAMASTEEAANGFKYGSHASTFGGNPLATRAALAVLSVVDTPEFLEHVRAMGAVLKRGLEDLAADFDVISEVRGMGLMLGAHVGSEHAGPLVAAARDEGLLINSAGGIALRFVPPLVIEAVHVEEALSKLRRALEKVVS